VREVAVPSPAEKPVHGDRKPYYWWSKMRMPYANPRWSSSLPLANTVLSAANGKEALDQVRARANVIDLVITDVVMPKMSGPTLAANLASLRPDLKSSFRLRVCG
jgi:CheY-like chemotaxis protein